MTNSHDLKASRTFLDERPESVKTGRQIAAVAGEGTGLVVEDRSDPQERAEGDAKDQGWEEGGAACIPGADAGDARSRAARRERWIHEIKFDGYRLQARIDGGRIKLLTRNRARLDQQVRQAAGDRAAGAAGDDGIARRRVVVETGAGHRTSSALQADLSEGRTDRLFSMHSICFTSTVST